VFARVIAPAARAHASQHTRSRRPTGSSYFEEEYQGWRPIYHHIIVLTHSGLLYNRVRLDKSFSMGPRSTSGDENSLRYDLGPHHCGCHVSTQ
jgi:hypothetical protein